MIFVLYSSDDGIVYNSYETKEEAMSELGGEDVEFLEKFPRWEDELYYGYNEKKKVVIIEGDIKIPKPVKIVKGYDF